ncbi:MAG: hypothetical protein A2864_02325 [Candidatus Woykebacteria bacterium RIFCSPHIGHO2_01_FULL_39_12]|uniref:DUF4349 domain-containing protein n=1 Tax=Candidatus Woykebacteria bacterium RIFCSPHIGHO2_01_FULL_39_12 TaxID=1802599 RepID=A0A1G1WGQ0_9BACT|nr:MAG: hypothetical protein A2864_02325 [Candidatus Woykebacteria bacterium RIFCSPHIGHO2_01_FULL_39_12]
MPVFKWIRNHILVSILILIIGFLLLKNNFVSPVSFTPAKSTSTGESMVGAPSASVGVGAGGIDVPSFSLKQDSGSSQQSSERIVIKNSNLSLLVKDVRNVGEQILNFTKNAGGYMVSTSYNRPDESPFATLTVRVPTDKLDEALKFFRSQAVKVTSENLVGTDVTDEFTDIQARLSTLEKTKTKFEGILDKATVIQDILTIQEKLITLQSQIDSLKGKEKALKQNAAFTKVTLFLSTDELALPYAPDKAFRPDVVFKQAVRSMLNTLRTGAEALIWVGVYSVIWIPALAIFFFYRRWRRAKQKVAN